MYNREELENKLFNDYLEKDITVIITGDIETLFIIHNCKILINDYRIVLTNSKKEEIILSFNNVVDVKIENCIKIDYDCQSVIIDC